MHPAPSFAMLTRGDLRLVLSAPGGRPAAAAAMPDGTLPRPAAGIASRSRCRSRAMVARCARPASHFRNDIVTGVGGRQILVDDPSGNPVELFEPTRPEAALSGSD